MREMDVDALLLSLGRRPAMVDGLRGRCRSSVSRCSCCQPTIMRPSSFPSSRRRGCATTPVCSRCAHGPSASDPAEVVAELVGTRRRLAVSDRCWACHLLELERALPHADWSSSRSVVGALRAVKDVHEIAALARRGSGRRPRRREHCSSGEIALIGRSEAEVSAELSQRLRRRRSRSGELRHRRERSELGEPAPRAGPAGDRPGRGCRVRLRRLPRTSATTSGTARTSRAPWSPESPTLSSASSSRFCRLAQAAAVAAATVGAAV